MAKIRRINSEEERQVCFSKRWAGLFKMARELAILCGVEVAAVTISPAGKGLSFGHPSFAPTGARGGGGGAGTGEVNTQLEELIHEYRELRALLAAEKAREERAEAAMAKERAAGNPMAVWLEADIRDLGEEELEAYAAALAEMHAVVYQDAVNRAMAAKARSSNNNNSQVQVQPPTRRHGDDAAAEFGFPGPN